MTSPTTRWLNTEEQQVWRLWLRAHGELNAALARQMQSDHGMSMADFEVLVHLSEAPDGRLRATALADTMLWERSRLSHQVRRMEARGLLERRECSADGRGSWVNITDTGKEALAAVAPAHVDTVRAHFVDLLCAEDLAVLRRITDRVVDSLG
ncbi:MarR family winged helix-turn-helix transcriptional regulator [Calidifontibacter terrae]